MAEDDELAAQWVESGAESRSRPGLDEWSLTNALLAEAVDRLGVLPVVMSGDKNARPPRPFPRPVTAMDRVRDRKSWSKHTSLVDEVKQAQARWRERGGGGDGL